jgi:hypothetical protein
LVTGEDCGFVLIVGDSANVAGGLGVNLLLARCHHVVVLNTVAHELEEPDLVVGFAAKVGQTCRLFA